MTGCTFDESRHIVANKVPVNSKTAWSRPDHFDTTDKNCQQLTCNAINHVPHMAEKLSVTAVTFGEHHKCSRVGDVLSIPLELKGCDKPKVLSAEHLFLEKTYANWFPVPASMKEIRFGSCDIQIATLPFQDETQLVHVEYWDALDVKNWDYPKGCLHPYMARGVLHIILEKLKQHDQVTNEDD